jgi:hypothetical protein
MGTPRRDNITDEEFREVQSVTVAIDALEDQAIGKPARRPRMDGCAIASSVPEYQPSVNRYCVPVNRRAKQLAWQAEDQDLINSVPYARLRRTNDVDLASETAPTD